MPIYEFYCEKCNTIFNFFSKTINTTKIPSCPKCKTISLTRQISMFAVTGRAKEDSDMDDMPFDEKKMEKAIEMMARETEKMNEDDPKQAAQLMRKLTDVAGLQLSGKMDEAIRRIERGEDPDAIEAEMGDILEQEEPFSIEKKNKGISSNRLRPIKDETLYDL